MLTPSSGYMQSVATFFSHVMHAIGGNTAGPGMFMFSLKMWMYASILPYRYLILIVLAGDAVVNVYINHEKKFAFVEMRSVEEASNAMALDGIIFEVC